MSISLLIHPIALEPHCSLFTFTDPNASDIMAAQQASPLELYKTQDYLMARLPQLEAAQLTDPDKGLWECWGMPPEQLSELGIRARDPALDVRDWNVAIDFGTSSTVVAYDENDQHKLLRIGVKDFWEKEKPSHYENPTVLEFIDFLALLEVWQSEAYRPGIVWDQVHCSHEALARFRDHENDAKVVASVLTRLKQWALREGSGNRVRITDQKNSHEHELAPLSLRTPVKGELLQVSSADPFDPIELYAWFLGLTINWRGRGIFLRYYMTFPVAYPRDVKDKIISAFQRGLQRSLPGNLIEQPVFQQQFLVEERASEPTAYAAVALKQLGIQPTSDGVAYAVFDFGGGTADFDYGYYRLANAEEEEEGKERVLEHFGAAGDRFLGGENLLENLAYRVFRHNLEKCRQQKIAFTRPLDAEDFPGSELFLEHTQAATSNTVMLMSQLRPFWENDTVDSKGMKTLSLLNREGEKVAVELAIPAEELRQYLQQRITEGVQNFFAALNKAFAPHPPRKIHILLAGNASRSHWVQTLFGQCDESGAAGEIIVHLPLPQDDNDPYRPTAKTGVALGLLDLCPGGLIKVINRACDHSGGEAPFAHYVGRIRQGKFQAGIQQGGEYGCWYELGVPSERVFNLYHTQSPRAHTGEMAQGEPGLYKKRIDLAGRCDGHKVFARIKGPALIELCTAPSRDTIDPASPDNLMIVNLQG